MSIWSIVGIVAVFVMVFGYMFAMMYISDKYTN